VTAPAGAVVEAAQRLLDRFDCIDSAFVYGSVAHGTARPGSDVDLFLITVTEPDADVRTRLHAAAERLQRELGYRPDPAHPVEVFPASGCADALSGPLVLRATHMAAQGREIDRITLDSDDLEIVRALTDRRLNVRPSPVLDSLTDLARRQVGAAARRLEVPEQQVLAGIGLTGARPVQYVRHHPASEVPR
jgi:predicted nucleotidyltransferase